MNVDLPRDTLDRFLSDEGGSADADAAPGDHGLDAVAVLLVEAMWRFEREVTTVCRFDERGGERVRRQRIRGRRQPEHLVAAPDELGVPLRATQVGPPRPHASE